MSTELRLAGDPEVAARRRLIVALEEVHAGAKALGLDPAAIGELYAPWALRVDAWLRRVHRDTAAWQRILEAPLFRAAPSAGVAP